MMIDKQNSFVIATKLITEFEGYVGNPYYCPALKLTIGYGEVILPHKKYGGILGFDIIQQSKPLPTIHNLKARNQSLKQQWGVIVTQAEAETLLQEYLKNQIWHKLKNHLPTDLTPNQQGAIMSFVYNNGVTAFLNSTLCRKLKNNDFKGASQEFDVWVFAGGKKLNGLIKRRSVEKAEFLTGV